MTRPRDIADSINRVNSSAADATAITIDANENVGINNTAPVEKLGISGNMRFINPNDNTSRITALPSGTYNVGNSGGSAIAFHRFSDSGGGSDEIFFETHHQGNFHGETLRIEKSGDIKVKRGDLYFETAGKGIVLGATSNTDANTLDDYEEGSFTPSLYTQNSLLSASYTNQDGKYTKIGRKVYFKIYIRLSSKSGGSGQLRINGLPFTSSAASGAAYGGAVAAYTYNWSGNFLDRMMIGSGSTQVQCFTGTSSGTNVNAGSGNLNNDTQMRIFGHYHV